MFIKNSTVSWSVQNAQVKSSIWEAHKTFTGLILHSYTFALHYSFGAVMSPKTQSAMVTEQHDTCLNGSPWDGSEALTLEWWRSSGPAGRCRSWSRDWHTTHTATGKAAGSGVETVLKRRQQHYGPQTTSNVLYLSKINISFTINLQVNMK